MPATKKPSASSAHRVIKKYPNRRLYDTTVSAYITLAEVKQMVVRSEPIKVLDAKTEEDLTRSILLQIILEEEAAGTPMFNEVVLAQLIRLYGQTMQGFMGPWLEQQLKWVAEWQGQWQSGAQGQGASPEAWAKLMSGWAAPAGLAPPSLQALQEMQEQMKKNTQQMLGALGLKS